ncbi:MAG: hypothetical protein LBM27_02350 [Lactobacillaceae bacterium]|jgi:hypothetical protein|nr:hypothetical protein [Lactobacillaceae bacterium]
MIHILRFKRKSILIYSLFVILAILAIVPFLPMMRLYGQGDLLFHLNRIYGLVDGLKSGELPYRVFNVMADTGSAVNFFYPFVYLLGFAALFAVLPNDVFAFYAGEAILLFVTLVVAYRAMMAFSKKNMTRSFLFAVLYGFAAYRTYLAFDQFVLGEAFAYAFLPLAFLGLYNVVLGNFKKWQTLAIGVSLVLYAHMLSTVLMIGLFIILIIVALLSKKITDIRQRIYSLLKAVGLTLLLAVAVYVPFVYAYEQTKITTTVQQHIIFLNGFGENVLRSLNDQYQNIGILGILALVSGFVVLFKKNYSLNLFWWVTGSVLFVTGTSVFPWHALPFAIQSLVQFPYRLFGMATLFLMVFLSKFLVDIFASRKNSGWLLTVVTLFALVGWFGKAAEFIVARHEQPTLINKNGDGKQMYVFSADSNQLQSIVSEDYGYIGMVDYAPTSAWIPMNRDSILRGEVLENNKLVDYSHHETVSSKYFSFKLSKAGNVDLPIFRYGNEIVIVDGKVVNSSQSSRGTVQLKLDAGNHVVEVSYTTPTWIYAVWLISGLGWITIVLFSIRHRHGKFE